MQIWSNECVDGGSAAHRGQFKPNWSQADYNRTESVYASLDSDLI